MNCEEDIDPGKTVIREDGNEPENHKPLAYDLATNFPNPFNPQTQITYTLPEDGYVMLKVYDVLGNEVGVVVNEYQ